MPSYGMFLYQIYRDKCTVCLIPINKNYYKCFFIRENLQTNLATIKDVTVLGGKVIIEIGEFRIVTALFTRLALIIDLCANIMAKYMV